MRIIFGALLVVENVVGFSIFASDRVLGGYLLISSADIMPSVRAQRLDFTRSKVIIRSCNSLNPELDVLGWKVEIGVDEPRPRRLIGTPGEDTALVTAELRAVNRVVMVESGTDLPARSRVP